MKANTKRPTKYIREHVLARAYVITKGKRIVAQIHILFPRDGAGTLRAECIQYVGDTDPNRPPYQSATAGGYGYDKEAAALSHFTVDGHKLANHCGETKKGHWPRDAKVPKGWYLCNYVAATETTPEGYSSLHKMEGVRYLRALGYTVTRVF